MLKSLPPTQPLTKKNLSENARKAREVPSHAQISPEEISHILYATTGKLAIRQPRIDLSNHPDIDRPATISLPSDSKGFTGLSAMCMPSKSEELLPQVPKVVIEVDDNSESLRICEIDECEKSRIKQFPAGQDAGKMSSDSAMESIIATFFSGDTSLTVTKDLRDTLNRVRDLHKPETFQIDQLSIHQEGLGGWSFQVQSMALVYN